MSKKLDTDTKVVQMRFDNSRFQKNINKTIKSVNELDKSLEFKEGKDGLKDVSKALDEIDLKKRNKELEKSESIVHKITVSLGSLIKIKVLSRALDTIINKTSAFVKNLTGINNVVAGWQQYEDQITNVGGILNQVAKDGYGLNDVADAMDRLRWYTDETSFSFTTLSNGIRQFTVAGIDLNKATEAAMGVTNLAGSAKVFDEFKVQSGMDAVAKAMQQGYMDTMKWTSLTNTAGIVTKDFTEILLEEAAAQGKLVKSEAGQYKTRKKGSLVTEDNIRNTLSEKWLTSDILTNALNRYNSASKVISTFMNVMQEDSAEALIKINELFKEADENFKDFTSMDEVLKAFPEDVTEANLTTTRAIKILEELGYAFDDVGLAAFKSSQETTTFSQGVKATADGIKSAWAGIFQSIFGNYEEATELWSDVTDTLNDIFVEPVNLLESTFEEWSALESGGLQDVHEVIKSVVEIVGLFKDAVGDAFSEVFGTASAEGIAEFVLKIKEFTENLKKNEALFKGITAVSKIFFSILKIIGKLLGTAFKIAFKMFTSLEPVFDLIITGLDYIAEGIINVINWIDELGILDGVVNGLVKVINWLANGIKNVVLWIKGKVDLEKVTNNLRIAIDWLANAFQKLGEFVATCWDSIKKWWNESEIAQKITEGFTKAIEFLKDAFAELGKVFNDVFQYFKEFSFPEAMGKAWDRVKKFGYDVWNFLNNVWGKIINKLKEIGIYDKIIKFWEKVKEVFAAIGEALAGFYNKMKEHFADKSFEEILTSILKALGIVMAIILAIQVLGIIVRWKWVLDSISTVLYSFAAKLKADIIKNVAISVLLLSGALWVMADAVLKLDSVNWGHAWLTLTSILMMFGILIAIFTALTALISKGEIGGSIKAAFQMVAFSLTLLILISVIKKMAKVTEDLTPGKLWLIAGIISTIMIAFGIAIKNMMAKSGWFQGVTPLLWSYIKTFGVMILFLVAVFKVIQTAQQYTAGDIIKGFAIIIFAVSSLIVLFTQLRSLKRVEVNKTEIKSTTISVGSLGLVILAAVAALKIGSKMSWGEIGRGLVVILSLFAALTVIAVSLMVTTAKLKIAERLQVKFGKSLFSISLSVLMAVLTIKLAAMITPYELGSGLATILLLYFVIGKIAIGLAKASISCSKAIKASKIGLNVSRKSVSKSPVGSTLLYIALTAAAFVGTIKLINLLTGEEIEKGLGVMTGVFLGLTAISLLLILASKKANGAAVKSAGITLLMVVGSIYAIIGAVALLDYLDKKGLISIESFVAIGIMLGALSGIAAMIIHISKKSNGKAILKAGGFILMIVGAIGALVGLIYVLSLVSIGKIWNAMGVLAVLTLLIVFISEFCITTMKKLHETIGRKQNVFKNMVKQFGLIMFFVLGIVTLATAVVLLAKFGGEIKQMWGATAVISVLSGLLLAIMVLTALISEIKIDNKRIGVLMLSIGLFVLYLGVLINELIVISNLAKDPQSLWIAVAVLAAIGGILLAIAAIFALITLIPMNMANGIVLIIAIAVFTAAIWIVADAFTKLGTMDQESMIRGRDALIAIGVVLGSLLLVLAIVSLFAKMGNMIVGLVAIVAIAGAIWLVAQAIKKIADIPTKDVWKAVGAIAALLGGFTVIVALLSLLADTGIGMVGLAIAAVVLIAIAGAILMVANAIKIVVEALNRAVDALDHLVEILNGITPDIVDHAKDLGKALIVLGAANLVSGIMNLGGALADLGASIAKNMGAKIDVVTKFYNAIGDVFEAFGKFAKDAGNAAGIKIISKALDSLNLDKMNAFNTFINNLANAGDSVNRSIAMIAYNIDAFKTVFSELINVIGEGGVPGGSLFQFLEMMVLLAQMPIETLESIRYMLDVLNQLLEKDITIEPKITPIFDMTQFDAGLTYMKDNLNGVALSGTNDIAYAAKNASAQRSGMSEFFRGMFDTVGLSRDRSPIQIIQNFNDTQMYGYDARRGIANTILDNITGLFKR